MTKINFIYHWGKFLPNPNPNPKPKSAFGSMISF